MIVKTVRVSDKGQIAIPTEVRKACGIERGANLILLEDSGRILLEREEALSKALRTQLNDMLAFTERSLKKVWDNAEDDIWNTAGKPDHPGVPVHQSRREKTKTSARRQQ